ncbi:MAG: DMT family transporter [Hyphomonadaceae bacterium]|nr:DMT family transporter [Hyphomonadaceae bacterium]
MALLSDLSAAHARLSHNVRGALWMLASACTFTAMTTLIKFLGDDYSPALQTFYRQAAGLLVMLPFILRDPVEAFRTTRPWMLGFRALGGTIATILAFYAYQKMPLAEANALSFTRTLWIVPLAILVLRERVGPWRIGATLIGFGGVLLMLQPAIANSVGMPAIAALASAAMFAATVTGMKMMTRDHTILSLTAWSAVLGFVLSIPMGLAEWRWPSLVDFVLLFAMGAFGLINQVFFMKGMAVGDAAAMAPMDYTRLIFAVLVGFVAFHEVPNGLTMAGAAIVIASTLFITLREAKLKKPPAPADQ